jgi:prepilin-type N-terminal cleavage/methylation domain-containing protein
MYRCRDAFTLTELLVTIALVGTGVALVLPVVRMVRDSASLSHGQDNLRRIGQAVQGYHDNFGCLPHNGTGALAPDPGKSGFAQPGPWTWQLLPFLEHNTVVEERNFAARIDVYLCPGRDRRPVEQSESALVRNSSDPNQHNGWWPTDYAINIAAFPGVYAGDEVTSVLPVKARMQGGGESYTIWGGQRSLSRRRYACNDRSFDEAAFFGGHGGTGRSGAQVISDSRTSDNGQNTWGSPFRGGAPLVFLDGRVSVFRFGSDVGPFLSSTTGEVVAVK